MTRTGYFKCREVKTGFYRNRSMQTGSSGTLIGWKSDQTTFVPLWDRMEGAWLRTLGADVLYYNRSHFWLDVPGVYIFSYIYKGFMVAEC